MIPDLLRLSAALLTLIAFGYALTRLVAPQIAFDRFERFGVGYVLGTGAASLIWILFMPAYGVVSPVVLISGVAWTTVALAIAGRRTLVTPPRGQRPSLALVVLLIVAALQAAAVMFTAMRSELGFDAVFNFEVKARLAFESPVRGQIPLAYFSDASRIWSHPRYPLVVPFAEFWLYAWLGRADQFLVKIIFPLYYIALMAVAAGAIQRHAGRTAAAASIVGLGLLPAITVIPGAISGYAEIPLAAAVTAAVCCTLIGLNTERREAFWLAGIFAALASWTKVEGAVLALCLGGVALCVAGRRAVPILVLPLCVIVAWAVFQHRFGLAEKDFLPITPLTAFANLDRVPMIARMVGREIVTPGHWGLLWPAFAAACALSAFARRWSATATVLASLVMMPAGVYAASYLFSSWTDVDGHIRTSFVRLLVPLAPIALIFIASTLTNLSGEPAEA